MNATNKTVNVLIPPSRFPGGACAPGASSRRRAASGLDSVVAIARSRARAILMLATAALAAFGPALGARAQGSVVIDNSQSTGRFAYGAPGHDYGGAYGVEVWMLTLPAVPRGINGLNNPFAAYLAMREDGLRLQATFADQNNSSTPGIIRLGEVDMPDVTPKGANVVIALAMWDSAGPTFESGALGWGVLAFVNPTADYTAVPAPVPPALSGWTSDLVMINPIPEPSVFALAAAAAAAWLLVRRRGG